MNLYFRLQSKIWHYTICKVFVLQPIRAEYFNSMYFDTRSPSAHSLRASMQMNNVDKCEWKFMNFTNIMKLYLNLISYEDWNTSLIFVSEKFSYVQKKWFAPVHFGWNSFFPKMKQNIITHNILSKRKDVHFLWTKMKRLY